MDTNIKNLWISNGIIFSNLGYLFYIEDIVLFLKNPL